MSDFLFHIMDIIRGTTVDGPGFRTAIYLSGCNHKCHACHNPQSWDFDAGREMTLDEILAIVKEEDFNVTISGGDPLCSPEKTKELTRAIKQLGYDIWLYTGYTYEQILSSPILKEAIKYVDVIVDGPFIEELKDIDLPFRGSSNQRIIHLKDYIVR